jgi:iron complex outermembrane receptor protein
MRNRKIQLAALSFLVAIPGSYSFAAAQAVAIEEVLVTARKREEDMQSVAIAVSVFDSEALRVNSITGLEDIARRTPGFVWGESSSADPNLFIRGIGTAGPSTFAGGDPSVVVMVDGVYIGRISGANTDLFDLERIEVLRGPQGTVYGKNAVGGVVNIISKRPSSEPEAQIEASIGNFDRANFKGYVTGPLTDTISAKIAVSSLNRDGFVLNEETGNDLWDEDSISLRAGLLFTPNDKLEALFTVESVRERESGAPRDLVESGTFNGGIHAITNPDPRVVNATEDSFGDRDILGLTLQVDYQMELGDLTSVTGFRDTEADWRIPFFGNPVTPTTIESTNINTDDFWQFSQELRLSSRPGESALDWTVGVFYFKSDSDRFYELRQEFASFLPFLGGIAEYDQTVETESWAVFGELNYQLSDTVQVTAGARYSTEEKKQIHSATVIVGPFPPPLSPANQFSDLRTTDDWDAFTPSVSVDWQVAEEAMVYASVARGFKSGGYQGIPPDAVSAATPFDPEFAWNYEVGAKTQWFDNRARLNVTAFFIDHEDLQIAELIAGDRVVIGNAAKAEVKGVEVEFLALPHPNLQLAGSYAFLDAEFSEFADGATTDNTGNTLPMAPEHKVNLSAQYDVVLSDAGTLSLRVDWTRQSKIFLEASNTTEIQGAYSLWDARVAFRTLDERWELAAFGKNLGDQLYRFNSVAFPPFGQELVLWSPPRTYGVTATWMM